MGKYTSTDIALSVRTSEYDIAKWDREKICKSLLEETSIDKQTAETVGIEVEDLIRTADVKYLTAPLIRELVNSKLIEHGLENIRAQYTRLGIPIHDVEQLLLSHNKENANVPHGPEATNLTLSENIKKQYAALNVFSRDVADGHMCGDIHLHDMGMVDRPYCSGQSMEYIKKFGLNLPNALSIARPAKHPTVLLEQMVKFSAALQGHFAGAIGWDAVNVFMAPYLVGLDHKELKQLAQVLVYEYAQQAVARGGQSIFSDLNIYWEVPKHFQDVDAIGPGGLFTGNTYLDYIEESQRFAQALFEVYKEGDARGNPFFFPKPEVHITDEFFRTDGHEEFLHQISDVASDKGNTYYVFDRGDTAKISECCRLSFELDDDDLNDAKTPWKMRYSAMQNVTINLPRIAYEANGDDTRLFEIITERMELAAKAHVQKRAFITKLLDMGKSGPLALLAMDIDGEPYYRLQRATHLMGMLGLNEMIQFHTGEELHASRRAFKMGLRVMAHMNLETERLNDKYGLRFVLEQTPAESTAYRMAKLDMREYPLQASQVMKGDVDNGGIYYTNSTYLNVSAPINPIERVKLEGQYHPMITAGALSHVWLGDARPDADALAKFVVNTFQKTGNAQIAFSPEFTSCLSCGRSMRGLHSNCAYCGSDDVEGITRVTGFFSKVTSWNDGKIAELKDRYKSNLHGTYGG